METMTVLNFSIQLKWNLVCLFLFWLLCVVLMQKHILFKKGMNLLLWKVTLLANSSFFLTPLFLIIFFLNLVGLIPMFMSITTQLMLIFPLAMTVWGSGFLMNLFHQPKVFLSSLIPVGVSMGLAPIMSMIEMISHFLRPVTLSVRLSANMTVGHVMLSLITITFMTNFLLGLFTSFFIFLLWVGYFGVEFFISGIQSIVFTMLNSMYLEVHS